MKDYRDLDRVYELMRVKGARTVLEFGVGYSTLRIASALTRNKADWDKLEEKPLVRNRFMFQVFSVDGSEGWLNYWRNELVDCLTGFVNFCYSGVKIGQWMGQVCSFYERLPDIVPDFIYLDGPDPAQVEGDIHGLSFGCLERTVMAGDILLMESTLLPGCTILVDGRTNNARFLERNFTRNWKVTWDQEGDVTIFELDEPSLGRYNHVPALL